MIILCNTLLPNDRMLVIPADVGTIIKPKPIIDRIKEIEVVPVLAIVSRCLLILNLCLAFHNFYLFLDLCFLSLKYVISSSMLLTELLKLLISFNFFSNRWSKSVLPNGSADKI